MSSWRDIAAPIIEKVIKEVGRSDMKTLRAALREAYPFGQRRYHPYKVWCDEVRIQLGLKNRKHKLTTHISKVPDAEGQGKLFGQ